MTHTNGQPQEQESTWSICQSLNDLSLEGFITCYVDGDLTALLSEDDRKRYATITEAEKAVVDALLAEAWLSLYSDYCGRVGGIQIKGLIKRVKSIHLLSSKIERVTLAVEALRMMYAECLVGTLKADGYIVAEYQDTDPDAYYLSLDRILARIKPDIMKLKGLLNEMPESEEKKKPEREEFEMALIEISKHVKYEVGINITTLKYCLYIQDLKRHIELLTKQAKNGTRRSD